MVPDRINSILLGHSIHRHMSAVGTRRVLHCLALLANSVFVSFKSGLWLRLLATIAYTVGLAFKTDFVMITTRLESKGVDRFRRSALRTGLALFWIRLARQTLPFSVLVLSSTELSARFTLPTRGAFKPFFAAIQCGSFT